MRREPTEKEIQVAISICVAEHPHCNPGIPYGYNCAGEFVPGGERGETKPQAWMWFLPHARAAIRAMYEPTKRMLDAGAVVEVDTGWGGRGSYKPVGDAYREQRWKQMVDAASPGDK